MKNNYISTLINCIKHIAMGNKVYRHLPNQSCIAEVQSLRISNAGFSIEYASAYKYDEFIPWDSDRIITFVVEVTNE